MVSPLAALVSRDPHRIALRRAARVAVAVPVAIVVLGAMPALTDTSLFGTFACLALLVFADFGGPLPLRGAAYLLTVLAAVPILAIGVTFGQSIAGAALVMAAVTMTLGMLAVLRGLVAAAQSTLLLATVLAVTSSQPGTQLQVIAAWLVGGILATAAALLLWPAQPSRQLHATLATAFQAAATATRRRWIEGVPRDECRAPLEAAVAAVHGHYDGDLMRPSGLTSSDRRLAGLVDIAGRIALYHQWRDVTPADAPAEPELDRLTAEFAAAVADQLDAVAGELQGRGHPDPNIVLTARQEHLDAVSTWVEQRVGELPVTSVRNRVDDVFPLRLTSVSAELAAADDRSRFHDDSLGDSQVAPINSVSDMLLAHFSWRSPWFRNAARTAVALGTSVALAEWLALGHEFWIVLGTLTALRFDALGTGRTVRQALMGTTAGVVLGGLLITLFGSDHLVWWFLLPVALFIAAYTPGTFSLATGQAGFSLAVLVLFTLLFPADLRTAELRFVDVAIGLSVSLVISLVMWPRGVVAALCDRMREGMDAATDHLVLTIDYLAGGAVDRRILADYSVRAARALDRAQETYDLSVAQRPPRTTPIDEWSRFANAGLHVDVAARLLPGIRNLAATRGAQLPIPPVVVGPLLYAANDMRERLRAAARAWDVGEGSAELPGETHPAETEPVILAATVIALRDAIDRWLEDPDPWLGMPPDPRPAMLIWVSDWTAFIDWNAELLRRDLQRAGVPAD